jgi:hypothetical protein
MLVVFAPSARYGWLIFIYFGIVFMLPSSFSLELVQAWLKWMIIPA